MSRIIHAALDKHLKAMKGLDKTPIAWENDKFVQPKDGGTYIKTSFMPASSDYGSLGEHGSVHERGIYQVGISALGGSGSGDAEKLADKIIAHFRRKTIGVVRTMLPTRSQAMPDQGRIWLAVSIPYFVETFF
jgi:hypothetical protein